MESEIKKSNILRKKRKLRVRKKLRRRPDRPRMCVTKSNSHIYVQIIDDVEGKTLVGLSTNSKTLKSQKLHKNKEAGKVLGETLAKMAVEKGISQVVFDRGENSYEGILEVIAESARENGLKI